MNLHAQPSDEEVRLLSYRILRVVGMTIWGIVFFTAMSIVGGVLEGFVNGVLHYKF